MRVNMKTFLTYSLLVVVGSTIDCDSVCQNDQNTLGNVKLIGHRGAPGTYPDHTLQSYQEAIRQDSDYVECDIVVTRDLQLICRHEFL